MKATASRLTGSRPGLAWKRYADARGNIMAAGIGYFAFFSIFPAVALAFSVFGFVLRGHPDLLHSVFAQLATYLPGLVKDAQHPDGLLAAQAPQAAALTLTGIISLVTLVLAGMGWLRAVREGIRAVFGAKGSGRNLITNTARDLGVLVTLGLGIALVAVLTTGVGGAAGWIAGGIGLSGGGWVLMADFAVSVLADTTLMIVLLRVVSGVAVPWRDLLQGALVGGIGFSLLKITAAALLPRLSGNPLFASIVAVVGLLIWLNLIARLTLISAAWAANDLDVTHPGTLTAPSESPGQVPAAVGPPGARAVREAELPTFGTRSLDRTTLGSGFVLGAVAVAATGVLARGIRSMARLVRD